jgi:galactose mutarotase-like enzyme
VRLAVGDTALDIDLDAGGRASQWWVDGIALLAAYGTEPAQHGMYPMAPWAGRIRDNRVVWNGHGHDLPVTFGEWAIHGTALGQQAAVLDHEQDLDHARLAARIEAHPGWPWPMAVHVIWELRERAVTTTIEVHALVEPFPAVVGWHPWFRRDLGIGGPIEWSVDATGRLERGDDHLPTGRILGVDPGEGPFDDAFVVPSGRAALRWPGVLAVDIVSDGGWYVVFDELPDQVCVEPQSGPPDGLREAYGHRPAIAAPGAPHTMVTTWTVRDLRR